MSSHDQSLRSRRGRAMATTQSTRSQQRLGRGRRTPCRTRKSPQARSRRSMLPQ